VTDSLYQSSATGCKSEGHDSEYWAVMHLTPTLM